MVLRSPSWMTGPTVTRFVRWSRLAFPSLPITWTTLKVPGEVALILAGNRLGGCAESIESTSEQVLFMSMSIQEVIMKKWFAIVVFAVFGFGATSAALANEFEDLRTEMTAARESLVTLVINKGSAHETEKIVR